MEKKLKTLKDLEMGEEGGGYEGSVFADDLKAEAIKWVKHKEELMRTDPHKDSVNYYFCKGEIHALKDFFNLTKEDLK